VIAGVGNYVIVNPSNLGNYVIADILPKTAAKMPHGGYENGPLTAIIVSSADTSPSATSCPAASAALPWVRPSVPTRTPDLDRPASRMRIGYRAARRAGRSQSELSTTRSARSAGVQLLK
jgi:hypothetical protein